MRNKTKNQRFYRKPRTTQERRVNHKRNKWCRKRRNGNNLTDSYDDRCSCVQKTWKVKRRQQYRECGRGQQHTVFLPNDTGGASWRFWVNTWNLEEWFNNHDIPCRVEKVQEIEVRVQTHQRVYKCTGWEPYTYVRRTRTTDGAKKSETLYETKTSWRGVYSWVKVRLAKPRETYWSKLTGYRVTWWSDKDIGIDYVIQQHVISH